MVILDRKIVHNVQTMCSHITYTEFNLPFHRHSEYELILFTSGSGTEFVGEGLLTTKRATLHLSAVIFPICIYAKVEWEIAKKQKLWNIVQVKQYSSVQTCFHPIFLTYQTMNILLICYRKASMAYVSMMKDYMRTSSQGYLCSIHSPIQGV